MTDKELRKLNRADLLELLLMLKKENDQLTRQVQQLQAQVDDRKIVVDKAGSIAEASLQLNGVFESAQAACGQYMENIEKLSTRQEEVCRQMELRTRQNCERMIAEAKQQSQAYWDEYTARVQEFLKEYEPLRRELLQHKAK